VKDKLIANVLKGYYKAQILKAGDNLFKSEKRRRTIQALNNAINTMPNEAFQEFYKQLKSYEKHPNGMSKDYMRKYGYC